MPFQGRISVKDLAHFDASQYLNCKPMYHSNKNKLLEECERGQDSTFTGKEPLMFSGTQR